MFLFTFNPDDSLTYELCWRAVCPDSQSLKYLSQLSSTYAKVFIVMYIPVIVDCICVQNLVYFRYMYSDDLSGLKMENVMNTLYAAKKYLIPESCHACRVYVQEYMHAAYASVHTLCIMRPLEACSVYNQVSTVGRFWAEGAWDLLVWEQVLKSSEKSVLLFQLRGSVRVFCVASKQQK